MDDFQRIRAELDTFNERHRQGDRLPLVPEHVAKIYGMPAVRGEGHWTRKLTFSHKGFFLWLVETIAAVGGRLIIDFEELERETGTGKRTLSTAAQLLQERGLLLVDAEPGATRYGLHSFRLSPSTAEALLATPPRSH